MFVCYAHDDASLVYGEMKWLHEAGIRLWYDDGVRVGSVWRRVLAEALEGASGLVFMQTPQSVQSEFCLNEIRFALDEQMPVFVVTLEPSRLPAELRLSLGERQALVKSSLTPHDFRQQLTEALRTCLGDDAPATEEPSIQLRRTYQQRRLYTVAVAFVDIGNTTQLATATDDIEAGGGQVLSRDGTVLFVAFDSLRAAVSVLTRHQQHWRVGLSCGDLLFEDGLLHGAPVNEALALKDQANVGDLLCADHCLALIDRSGLTTQERGIDNLGTFPDGALCVAITSSWDNQIQG